MTTPTDIFGTVIHSHTRAEALADGTLVAAPTDLAAEAGFRFPVALTSAAWADTVAWDEANAGLQDETGRLWDVLMMARHAIKRAGGDASRQGFQVCRVPNTAHATTPRLADLVVHCGPGDNAEPVLTILLPHED